MYLLTNYLFLSMTDVVNHLFCTQRAAQTLSERMAVRQAKLQQARQCIFTRTDSTGFS